MRKIPKNLSQDQKNIRRVRFVDFLESIENGPQCHEHVITSDESWMFQYDPETKLQSME